MAKILIIDDDLSMREVLEIALVKRGHKAFTAADSKQAWACLEKQDINLVLLDLRLGRESGVDVLRRIKEKYSNLPVLMITAFADTQSAVEALKLGARAYITKPFELEDMTRMVDNTLAEAASPFAEDTGLRARFKGRYGPIIGESSKIVELLDLVKRIAPTQINVLIAGESGTGKELIARAIHTHSLRAEKPFMAINCGGLPDNLVESELFGFRKGAFTGADHSKKGLLETACGGTVFMDEVTELAPNTQVKLLRFVQERNFIPLGGTEEVSADVRLIAATNRSVEDEVARGKFREDLYYRMSGVIIRVPALRERGNDILLLAEYFLQRTCQEQKRTISGFTPEAKEKLLRYNYPGNIRELENIIERAVALELGDMIGPDSLVIYEKVQAQEGGSGGINQVLSGRMSLEEHLAQEEQAVLKAALERTGGHKGKAAELVGLNFRQFRYRLSKLGMDSQNEDNEKNGQGEPDKE